MKYKEFKIFREIYLSMTAQIMIFSKLHILENISKNVKCLSQDSDGPSDATL